jgi:L-threonylcarbamoyladenylate synthase
VPSTEYGVPNSMNSILRTPYPELRTTMKTIILKISKIKPEIAKLRTAVEVLETGGVIVIPTDTVYGLASKAFDSSARERIYKLKGRSFSKPLIMMAGSQNSLKCLYETPKNVDKIIDKFWPGPLTLVMPCSHIGKIVMAGRANVGVRVPDHKVCLSLMKMCSFPLATTSANTSKKPSAKSFKEAFEYFNGKVDLIIDSGVCKTGCESSVLDVTHFPYTVIRHGAIKKEKLMKECGL